MSETCKPCWLQFRLRSLFVVTALVGLMVALTLCWLEHRRYCLERANFHHSRIAHGRGISFHGRPTEQDLQDVSDRMERENEAHRGMEEAFRRAAWYPWEGLWIVEPSNEE